MRNKENTLSFVLVKRKFKATLLPNIYTVTKNADFRQEIRPSTTQDTTILGSKTVHNPCQQQYTKKKTL